MTALALGLAAVLVLPDFPRAREDTEALLRAGRILSSEAIGQGITESRRVEVERGGQRLRGIFKTVETRAEFPFRFGAETAPVYRDRWQHEVAAYELDKLLGLGLVPPSVERKIEGRRGSLQAWVEDKMPRFGHGQSPPDRGSADDAVHAVRLLDYLIFNTDRHLRNLAFAEDWRPIVIDHSIAFHAFRKPPRPLHRFPRGPVERLRRLDRRQLAKALGRYLERDQIDAIEARRGIVLGQVDAAIAERGEAAVLFEWGGR